MSYKNVRLGDLVEVISGGAFKSKFFTEENTGMPLIRIRDVTKGYSETYYSGEFDDKFIINDGDLLITMDGEFNIREWYGGQALLNQRVCKIESREPQLKQKFLLYVMPAILKKIEDKTPYVTVKHLSVKKIMEASIPLPSIEIQEKIIKILDKSQWLIKRRQQQIEALSILQHSTFNKMFITNKDKYPKVPLKEICEINPSKSEVAEELNEIEITFLPMSAVGEEGEVNLNETRILRDVYRNYTYFAEDDVLFAKITPCMENGKGAIARGLKNNIGFGSTEFHVLRPKKGIIPEWIYFLTKSREFRKSAEGNMTGSAGQKRVPRKFLEDYPVIFPSESRQEEFKKIYSETEKIKQKLSKSLFELENLSQNLTNKAFKGDLFKEDLKV